MEPQIRKLAIALIVLFAALFAQLNVLQLLRSGRLANDPRNTRAVVVDFSRERGKILAADGAVLAESVPVETTFQRLRRYPGGPEFAPFTGFFSFNYGTDGAERTFNGELAGRKVTIRNLDDVLSATPKTNDVHLTVQPAVQRAALAGLAGRRGAVVALDARDGSILALASTPSYDPNRLAAHDLTQLQQAWSALQRDPAKPMLPRPYRERYSPGSTFKVVTAAAAVDLRPDLAAKAYPVEQRLPLRGSNRPLPNFGGGSCGGALPELLRVSCNTGFGRLGLDLGAEALREEAEAFGWGERPPIDLPAPARSTFPTVAELKGQPALATTAIGQLDVTASPLQMALVAAAIGSGGKVPTPHVLSRVTREDGSELRRFVPSTWKEPLTSGQAAQVRDMMVGVVERGTARAAAVPGVQVAAKTGTAQTTGDDAHAWITAFAPAASARVAVAVIVESQPGVLEATGGTVAAPIARQVLQAALQVAPA